jgi:hypothetical protein
MVDLLADGIGHPGLHGTLRNSFLYPASPWHAHTGGWPNLATRLGSLNIASSSARGSGSMGLANRQLRPRRSTIPAAHTITGFRRRHLTRSRCSMPCVTTTPPGVYRIRIKGRIGATALSAFRPMVPEVEGRDTVLTGFLPDRSAVFGVLAQIEALGLELLELRQIPARPKSPESGGNRSPDAL